MGILDTVPPAVRAAATKAGISNSSTPTQTAYQMVYMPQTLKNAYASANYAVINDVNQKAVNDLNTVWAGIKKNKNGAWLQMEDGTPQKNVYYITNSSDGWIWVYAQPSGTGKTSKGHPATYVLQIGTYSNNATMMGISSVNWDNSTSELATEGVTHLFTSIFTGYVWSRLSGNAAQAAIEGGLADAEAEAIFLPEAWEIVLPAIVETLVTMFANVVLDWLENYITSFFKRNFRLIVNVRNFDTNNWVVNGFADDNTVINSQMITAGTKNNFNVPLPSAPSDNGESPFKPKFPQAMVACSSTSFTFENSSDWAGMGISMAFTSVDKSAECSFKYNVTYMGNNRLGLDANYSGGSFTDYYNDKKRWADDGDNHAEAEVTVNGRKIPIIASTNYLKGAPKGLYIYNVHIGQQRTAGSKAAVAASELQDDTSSSVKSDKLPPVQPPPVVSALPAIGSLITLPDRSSSKVLAYMK